MSIDDAALLERWIARRDAEAFDEIVRRFADQVFGACRRILRNDADAEEVAQECFLLLVRSSGEVRTSLGGWLHRAATTKSLDRIRREASRPERPSKCRVEISVIYRKRIHGSGSPTRSRWRPTRSRRWERSCRRSRDGVGTYRRTSTVRKRGKPRAASENRSSRGRPQRGGMSQWMLESCLG